jgi:hypothetical protein
MFVAPHHIHPQEGTWSMILDDDHLMLFPGSVNSVSINAEGVED